MDWHQRYRQQAKWTEDLRNYIFNKIEINDSSRMLEIGCGTGAILKDIPFPVYALDIQLGSLQQAKANAPTSPLTCGDAHFLPYENQSFDISFCHFLFLWLNNPETALAEMMRVTRPNGHIVAFAEPDYSQRLDIPDTLAELGVWQRDALKAQGADTAMGAKLAELFHRAGLNIIETGPISKSTSETFDQHSWELEWAVLESDLASQIPFEKIRQLKELDRQAWLTGERVLYVPTHYLWARMPGG